jgi:hypothetical protein
MNQLRPGLTSSGIGGGSVSGDPELEEGRRRREAKLNSGGSRNVEE